MTVRRESAVIHVTLTYGNPFNCMAKGLAISEITGRHDACFAAARGQLYAGGQR